MGRYPDAKVVLTVRDPERWYDSARQTIYAVRRAFPRWVRRSCPGCGRIMGMVDRLVWDGFFLGRFEDRSYAIEVFDRHTEEVRRTVPPERLLVYEVREGWGPLCASSACRSPRASPSRTSTTPRSSAPASGGCPGLITTLAYAALGLSALLLGWLAIRFLW